MWKVVALELEHQQKVRELEEESGSASEAHTDLMSLR